MLDGGVLSDEFTIANPSSVYALDFRIFSIEKTHSRSVVALTPEEGSIRPGMV